MNKLTCTVKNNTVITWFFLIALNYKDLFQWSKHPKCNIATLNSDKLFIVILMISVRAHTVKLFKSA